MDLSLSVRFANLANNSQLEMKQRPERRTEQPVTVAVQAESGNRVQAQFPSSASLLSVIRDTTGVPSTRKGQEVVCIYMRKEIVGTELLTTTTLRSLGLNSGSAMLRVIARDAEALKTQAHVEDLKLSKGAGGSSKAEEIVSDVKQNVSRFGKSLKKMVSGVFDSVATTSSADKQASEKKEQSGKTTASRAEQQASCGPSAVPRVEKQKVASGKPASPEEQSLEIDWLGERDALAFTLEDMKCMRSGAQAEEVGEDFFEHTQEDVLLMYNDLKQRVREMEERALETAALREQRQSTSKYSKTVLRICFPSDGLMIQATFSPTESVESVCEFIRKYLDDEATKFYLYTTPPKQVLAPHDTLLKKQLVPAAVVHFGQTETSGSVLKPHLQQRVTSFRAIVEATRSLRRQVTDGQRSSDLASAEAATGKQDAKVPKWFKKS